MGQSFNIIDRDLTLFTFILKGKGGLTGGSEN
jgi:hypothetical protein